MFQQERSAKGEIAESTVPNYCKPAKIFCDMNNVIIDWKLVSRVMPHGNHAASDGSPTLEEIVQILKYRYSY